MTITHTEIQERLSQPLPGAKSHLKLAPKEIKHTYNLQHKSVIEAKKSAVMILLFEENNTLKVVLIRRSMYVGIHAGQVAFPGGRSEEFDADLEATALREVEEEIGIKPDAIEILGRLSDIYIAKSNFIVSTFVGFLREKPVFEKDQREVADIYELKLSHFFEDNIVFEKDFKVPLEHSSIKALYYKIENVDIWGASAMIMSEFVDAMVGESKDSLN